MSVCFLKKTENYLKGKIPSPTLENVLLFEYENQPHKEFVNGYTYTFNTKGHKKAKNTEISLDIPKSWTAREGRQPNVIQLFSSDCGNGKYTISIMTGEMQYTKEELGDLTFEEIDLICGHLTSTIGDVGEIRNWSEVLQLKGKNFPYINAPKTL